MALWFRRRKNDTESSTVPPEVQEYYQSERKERFSIAWLIAFISLVVTILLVILLFFGGRWIYRKIANRNKPTSTVQTQDKDQSTSQTQNQDKPSTNEGGSQGQNATPSPTPAPTTGPTTPITGDSSVMPRTGPDSDE